MIADGGLLEKARDGVMTLDLPACIKDSQLRYVCVNDAYAQFAGRSRQDFTGKTSRQLHGMADDGDRDDKERRCLVFATDEVLKCAGFNLDEAPTISCERFETEDGNLFLFEVFEAMPARRHSDDAANLQPDTQSILEHLPVGIMLLGPDLTIEYTNRCFYALLDIGEKIDLTGQHYRAYLEMTFKSGTDDLGNLSFADACEKRVENLKLVEGTVSRHIESRSGQSIILLEKRIGGGKFVITAFDCTEMIAREREVNPTPENHQSVGEDIKDDAHSMLEGPALGQDSRLSVLVIEDATTQDTLTEQLARRGIDAYAAEGTATALAILQEAASIGFAIDAIILNPTVPVLDGMQLARAMRQDLRLSDTAIIALTSLDAASAGHDEPDIQLMKPVGAELLRKTLTKLVHKSRARRSEAPKAPRSTIADPDLPLAISLDVLIAEDNDVNQIVFNQILQQSGLRYKVVNNGEQAIETWRAVHPSIILMDISMPVMNGYRATQIIRSEENRMLEVSRVPIIGVVTQDSDRDLCLAAGMDDYLSKPISPELLRAKIQKWLMKSLARQAN